jgi:heterodisulfide reductase subunit A
MEMFRMGVDGILVGGCPERSCHHLWGNFVADKRTELARAVLEQLGLSPRRLRFEYLGAPMQARLVETLEQMRTALVELGPNPIGRQPVPVSQTGEPS